jgi:hypothetical protein
MVDGFSDQVSHSAQAASAVAEVDHDGLKADSETWKGLVASQNACSKWSHFINPTKIEIQIIRVKIYTYY